MRILSAWSISSIDEDEYHYNIDNNIENIEAIPIDSPEEALDFIDESNIRDIGMQMIVFCYDRNKFIYDIIVSMINIVYKFMVNTPLENRFT